MARIKGQASESDETGNADEVDVDESVVGPISGIDTTNGLVTVLAQSVKINGGTSFSKDIQPADITGLKVGDIIRVDGMYDSTGTIVATRIERGSTSTPFQVVGTVSGLNSASHTFMINALIVDYSSATLSGFASGGPSNGDTVEVQGTSFNATAKTLTASTVARVQSDEEEAGDDTDIEREGLITRFASVTDFDVAGKPVTTTSSTVYENGNASELALNVKVEVEGMFNSSNVLVASVVRFEHNGSVELQSQVTAVNVTAGTLTLLGVSITVSSMTRFEDDSAASIQNFNLSKVNVGDTIKMRGYENPAASGMVLATRLEREPPTATVVVEGPFMAATSPNLTVLGITIDASSAMISNGEEGTLTLAEFLTKAVGHSVKVEGTVSGTVIAASRIRIDDESGDEN
jgi:cytoskeletal protein CcmA (bactofilin family)